MATLIKEDEYGKWYGPEPGFIPRPPQDPPYTMKDLKKDIDLIKAKLGIP